MSNRIVRQTASKVCLRLLFRPLGLHQVWLHEEPGLAGAGTADYKDILVSCGFGVFRPVVHGEPFRLCQQNVVVKIGVDIGGYILGAAP